MRWHCHTQDAESPKAGQGADLEASRSKAAALEQELAAARQARAAAEAARHTAELSAVNASRRQSQLQDLSQKLSEAGNKMDRDSQAARESEESLRKQLRDVHAELAREQALAGHRAGELAGGASAADESAAQLSELLAALEEESRKMKAAAHDELITCRDAGMKVQTRTSLK